MSGGIRIMRAGPLATIQDHGRFGMLRYGVAASGPMDRIGFDHAGTLARADCAAIEFTQAGLDFVLEGGAASAGFAGGDFRLWHNDVQQPWPARLSLADGDRISIRPGPVGNYGYVRLGLELDVQMLMGSRATNVTVGLGGLEGRALKAGDIIGLVAPSRPVADAAPPTLSHAGPVRFIWGLHADLFPADLRQEFVDRPFTINTRMDRMGVRLDDPEQVFSGFHALSLVSDAVVPGDIQILGDGTPIVLMRDHQPTGGYPRIGTVISCDLDRLAQMRPGMEVGFQPISPDHAYRLIREARGTR